MGLSSPYYISYDDYLRLNAVTATSARERTLILLDRAQNDFLTSQKAFASCLKSPVFQKPEHKVRADTIKGWMKTALSNVMSIRSTKSLLEHEQGDPQKYHATLKSETDRVFPLVQIQINK